MLAYMPYIFAAMIGVTSLAIGLIHAKKRLLGAEERIGNTLARKQAQVDRIRRVALATLAQSREIRDVKRRRQLLQGACEELEERLQASNAVDRNLYVLDDRRTAADLTWVAKVANTEYDTRVNSAILPKALDSWKRGRRHLVWALDEKKALEKLLARYPEHKGFFVHSVREQID